MTSSPPLQRPIPRRPFDIPDLEPLTPDTTPSTPNEFNASKRSRSTISLTAASTLSGIYAMTFPSSSDIGGDISLSRNTSHFALTSLTAPSPAHTLRAKEDSYSKSHEKFHSPQPSLLYLLFRIASLFALGIAYGFFVTHLQGQTGWVMDRGDGMAKYLVFWGVAGVGLGSLMPWLDGTGAGAKGDWSSAVRSIGAFAGIAYAIRKTPWQSTLQVSLTLALVNPFLWFIIDRTRSGFWFSTLTGILGTALILQTNPSIIQIPAHLSSDDHLIAGVVSADSVGVSTWIASVLFCSCVCFGNIGRRLALKETGRRDTA